MLWALHFDSESWPQVASHCDLAFPGIGVANMLQFMVPVNSTNFKDGKLDRSSKRALFHVIVDGGCLRRINSCSCENAPFSEQAARAQCRMTLWSNANGSAIGWEISKPARLGRSARAMRSATVHSA